LTFEVSIILVILLIGEFIAGVTFYYARKNWDDWDVVSKTYGTGFIILIQILMVSWLLVDNGIVKFV